jgi:hypothetical protein
MTSKRVPLSREFKLAREVVRRDMHSYDLLSRRAKIITERPVVRPTIDDPLAVLTRCAHDVLLHEPCEKCERSVEDCVVYLRQAQSRVKDLLSKLGSK